MSMDTQRTHLRQAQLAWTRATARAPVDVPAPRTAVSAGAILLGGIALLLIGHPVAWLAGAIFGVGGAAVALRRGADAADAADQRGAAEPRPARRTELALEPLGGAGWRFVHDVSGSEGVYDHIAVGSGGVILIESLCPGGVVTMESGTLILEQRRQAGGAPERRRIRPRAVAEATAFRDDVHRLTGCRAWVQAVVVFWCDFPAGCVVDGRCVYIHGSRLTEWLLRRPHQLDPAETDDVFAAVQHLARAGGELSLPIAV